MGMKNKTYEYEEYQLIGVSIKL